MDDAIADIATVFHWSPAAFDEMTVFELADWREKARARAETQSDF